MSDEEIIQRKLLFDGDSTGDERRINLLQKLLVNWVSDNDMTDLENLQMLNKSLSILRAIEYSWSKSKLTKNCNEKQLELYKNLQEQTMLNIQSIKETIDISKIILQDVRQEKQFKINFNMIAEDIVAMPSVQGTKRTAHKLNEDIKNLAAENLKLNCEWEKLKHHFRNVLVTSKEMEHILNQNKE